MKTPRRGLSKERPISGVAPEYCDPELELYEVESLCD
jgi:hypothetical protein